MVNSKFTYLDQLIHEALHLKKEVRLFLCKDEEGGFGIKVNGIEVTRNQLWEVFEYRESDLGEDEGHFNKLWGEVLRTPKLRNR